MARRRRRRKGKGSRSAQPSVIHPEAAGLDIGATEVYAAVRPDRDPDPIRSFPTFTVDLHALADWLKACQVTTVAMESTGVYWIPAHQILEAHGLEVVLVNARHVHSVPGRKSDVADCEWLRHLHSAGLLRGSFRPADEVCAATLRAAPSRHLDQDCGAQRTAHAEGVQPDERPSAPCHLRPDRGDRAGHNRRHPGR